MARRNKQSPPRRRSKKQINPLDVTEDQVKWGLAKSLTKEELAEAVSRKARGGNGGSGGGAAS